MKNKIILIFALIFVVSIVYSIIERNSAEDLVVKVTDKERIVETNSDGKTKSKYLIFTDHETFENTDTILFGKFNSSDLYGSIEIGKTYEMTVVGWRVPFLSMYRNVIKVQLINPNSNGQNFYLDSKYNRE